MHIAAFLLTCPSREHSVCRRTLDALRETDWKAEPHLHVDRAGLQPAWRSIAAAVRELLATALATSSADYILTLEDDLRFHPRLRHHLENWPPPARRPRPPRQPL